MGLSSNTLIHQTNCKENLIGILNEGFSVHYCYERVTAKNGIIEAAFPMVCFCDIPLSELRKHLDAYGYYGIGLKKTWAKEKGMNPVLYFDDKSDLLNTTRENFRKIISQIKVGKVDFEVSKPIADILSYSKNYEGELKLNGKIIDPYRFSDEREWRFVPDEGALGKARSLVSSKDYINDKDKFNSELKHIKLEFKPEDINYLIVKSEDEIDELLEVIEKSHGSKSTFNSVERLKSRVITTEQILYDF